MLISDINYLETVVESDNIEGSGDVDLIAELFADIQAQSEALAFITQNAEAQAFTGIKEATYDSIITLRGLT